MAKAKEPKSASPRTAKPTATRAATANRRPAIEAGGGSSSTSRAPMSPEEIYKLIQETAYYKAKARGFAPGHEVQDWIEAEAEVRLRMG